MPTINFKLDFFNSVIVVIIKCVFSVKQQLPVYCRLLGGNIKDVSSFNMCLLESQIKKDAVVIIDKGFVSKSHIEALEKEELKFIIPLPNFYILSVIKR
jgi:transposase